MIRNCGAEVESWIAEATHAFDDPTNNGPMRHHPALAEEALIRFRAFLTDAAPHGRKDSPGAALTWWCSRNN
jgi:dienelactone hydrolase